MDVGTIMRFAWLPIVLFVVLGFRALQGAQTRANAAAQPQLGLSDMAERLGLAIVEGDRDFHFQKPAKPPLWALLLGFTRVEHRVRLTGTQGPFTVSFASYSLQQWLKLRYLRLFEKHVYDTRLSIDGVATSVELEAFLVPASPYMQAQRRTTLPIVARLPTPAGELVVAGRDPSIATTLAPFADRLGELGYAHLVARPGGLDFVYTEIALVQLSHQLVAIRDLLVALGTAANASRIAA